MSVKAKERKFQLPKSTMRADVSPASVDKEKRTVELIWSVGKKGLRSGYDGSSYFEELSMDPAHIKLARLESGNAPLLDAHDRYSGCGGVIGVIESARIENGVGIARVRFADTPDVADTWRKVETGILKNVSVGYNVYRYERQPMAEGEEVPTYLATDWEPTEISIVPVGFDENAVVRAKDEQAVPCVFLNNLPEERNEEVLMTEQERKDQENKVAAERAASEKASADKARNEEKTRQSQIRSITSKLGLDAEFATRMIDCDHTVEQVREMAIEEKSKAQPEIRNANAAVSAGKQDETVTRREGIENALMHRSQIHGAELNEKGRQYRGMSLLRMAEEFVGPSARGMAPAELASRSLSSSDFPLILGNVAEKMLMSSYKVLSKTFEPFVAKGELVDYKAAKRYQVGDAPALDLISENGEYKLGSFGEKAESTQLADYGKRIRFSRQMLINDDLQAFQRVIQNFGSAAARLESKIIYTNILVGNPTMGDSVALFHASHGNLATAAAIDVTSVAAMEKLIMDQKTLDNEDYLNLVAKYLICGTAKSAEAKKLLASLTVGKIADANPYQGAYQLIVDPRISGNKWFLACSPSDIATIELARLVGENGPVVDSKEGWDSDGLEVKCRHTVAGKALEWKGIAYNPGA